MSISRDAEVLPVSSGQRRLWFLEQIESGGTAWNVQAVFLLLGSLDVAVLERSMGELIERHEAIRTTFEVGDDGEPVQVIRRYAGFQLPFVDLTGNADPGAAAAEWADRHWRQPFDIVRGPLLRTALLQVAPGRHHLVFDVHHLVADAWSLRIIYQELQALYTARTSGQDGPALPELPIQYGDFAVWEHERLTDAEIERSLAVWRERLGDAPAPTVFPADRRRGADGASQGETSLATLPPELVTRLRRMSEKNGVSLFMVLLAVFDVLLLRYCGEDDLIVGSGLAGRTHPDIEGLIGCFVNPVVLRTSLAGQPTFRELLGRVRTTVLEAFENQHVPFDRLVQELKPERSSSKQPFFQTMMQFTDINLEPARMGEVDIDLLSFSSEAPSMDLAVTLVEQAAGLTVAWEFNAGLFEHSTIGRMQGHFRNLLEAALADPDAPILQMRMLTEDEEGRLLAAGTQAAGTQAATPGGPRSAVTAAAPPQLHRLVEAHAASAPANAALVAGSTTVSYGDLNMRADRLARALASEGVGGESVVGVLLPRGLELPVILLAILKAGGTYLPLDPEYPAGRVAFMVKDSGAVLVVHDGPADPDLPAKAISVTRLEQLAAGLGEADGADLATADRPEGCAYVIYTSGSTGKPKGVQVGRHGLASLIQAQLGLFELTPADRVCQFFSPSFDASVFEIVMALGAGAALVVTQAQDVLPGGQLAQTLRDNAVTAVTMTPSALMVLGEAQVPTLRVVSAAGEACPLAALRHWLGQARCFNLYGPTEATIWSTSHEVTKDDVTREEAGLAPVLPIGVVVPQVRAHVLDGSLNLVPELVSGELYIGGAGVARGYLGQPRLTAERFLPDPFAPAAGARMYRSGDLVRRRSDGLLEFLSRSDDQVKVRGHRIELGEVEEVVSRCPAVRLCAATTEAADLGANRLVCYVVPVGDGGHLAEEVRAFVAERLPGYLIPDAVVVLADLPTLPSGKVDRNALGSDDTKSQQAAAPYLAPRTPMEQFLAEVWQELLKTERVGVNDDFFVLGGHSLAATLVGTRLKAELSLEVPVTLLFEHRVLGDYTKAVLECAMQTDTEFAPSR